MPEPVSRGGALEAECRTFCRYLIGRDPTDYILLQYARAHEVGSVEPLEADAPADSIGRQLVHLARRGPFWTRLGDSYAVLFAKRCLLRRKLVLLLAILESTAPTNRLVDSADPSGTLSLGTKSGFFLRAALWTAAFALTAALATVIVIPLRLLGPPGGAGRSGRGSS